MPFQLLSFVFFALLCFPRSKRDLPAFGCIFCALFLLLEFSLGSIQDQAMQTTGASGKIESGTKGDVVQG